MSVSMSNLLCGNYAPVELGLFGEILIKKPGATFESCSSEKTRCMCVVGYMRSEPTVIHTIVWCDWLRSRVNLMPLVYQSTHVWNTVSIMMHTRIFLSSCHGNKVGSAATVQWEGAGATAAERTAHASVGGGHQRCVPSEREPHSNHYPLLPMIHTC